MAFRMFNDATKNCPETGRMKNGDLRQGRSAEVHLRCIYSRKARTATPRLVQAVIQKHRAVFSPVRTELTLSVLLDELVSRYNRSFQRQYTSKALIFESRQSALSQEGLNGQTFLAVSSSLSSRPSLAFGRPIDKGNQAW